MRTCLEIVKEICGNFGLVKPNTAVSSNDLQVIQMLSLLNEGASKLARRFEWQVLTGEASFTTLAAASQGTLASIIGATANFRRIVDETIWNRTTGRIVLGPIAPEEWQGRLAVTTAGPYSEYRIRAGTLYFDPVPAAGESCYFEYVSYNWATDAAGTTPRARFTADDDLPLFDDELLLADLKWRWREAKGLDFQQAFDDFEMMVADAESSDKTARRIKMDNMWSNWARYPGVPNSSWNLTNLG